MTKKLKVELMLDSGIFSAWNRKEEISINDYMAYVKDYKHLLHSYIDSDRVHEEDLIITVINDFAQSMTASDEIGGSELAFED